MKIYKIINFSRFFVPERKKHVQDCINRQAGSDKNYNNEQLD
jgi:hypothetical protein